MIEQKVRKQHVTLLQKIDCEISWVSGSIFNKVKVNQKESLFNITQKISGVSVVNMSKYTFEDLKKIIIETSTGEIVIIR